VAKRPAIAAAAQLGLVERSDGGWMAAALVVPVLSIILILLAFGVRFGGGFQFPMPRWRWRILMVCILLVVAVDLGYLALGGRSANYVNSDERGTVTGHRAIHNRWGETIATDIECQVTSDKHSRYALVTYEVAFADGRQASLGGVIREGEGADWLDWDLAVTQTIRQAQLAKPSQSILHVRPNAECRDFLAASPGDTQAKFAQLFAPAAKP
jgi:hypothetical protein